MSTVREDKVLSFFITYRKQIILLLIVLGLGFLGRFMYCYSIKTANIKATVALSNAINLVKSDQAEVDMKTEILKLFNDSQRVAFEKLMSKEPAKLSPFILVQAVDPLLKKDRFDDAIELLNKAVESMTDGVMKDLLKIKRSRLMLEKEGLVRDALADLEKVALVGDQVAQAVAVYFLHQYYWLNRKDDPDFEKAINFGKQFTSLASKLSHNEEVQELSEFEKVVSYRLAQLYIPEQSS